MTRFHLSLVVTHACNLACRYCYMGEHHATHMSEALARRAVDDALDRAPEVQLSFFGGEPLGAWDLCLAVASHARERAAALGRRLLLQVTTNGTLLTRARAATLAEYGFHVAVSLDGDRAAHERGRPTAAGGSSFDAVVGGIGLLREAAVPFDLVAVTTPDNVGELASSVAFLAALGPERIELAPAFEAPWSDAALERWQAELEQVAAFYVARWRAGERVRIGALDGKLAAAVQGGRCASCGLGRWNAAVAPSGRVYPCDRLVGDDRPGRFVAGHLDHGLAPLSPLPLGPADAACAECPERARCGASCACANVAETGEPDRPGGVQCWYEQTVARLADEAGWALVAEGHAELLAAAYGSLSGPLLRAAQAKSGSPSISGGDCATMVPRRRRLPLVEPREP